MELNAAYKDSDVGRIPVRWACTTVAGTAASIPNAVVGGPFGSDLVSRDYVQNGVPVIRGQNMGSHFVQPPFVFVTNAKAASLAANLARPGDVIFTQRGTLGQVSLVPDEPYHRYLISQSQMKVTVDSERVDSRYFHLLFSGPMHQKLIATATIQTGVPHINLGVLRQIPVQLPPLPEQRAIAAALSDVDALIASLDRLIAKKRDLKQGVMQQLLTGQTRLPGFSGKWKTKRLGSVLRVRHGKSQHDVVAAVGRYPILATGGEIGRTDAWLHDKPSVLIGRKGTIDSPQYVEGPFWTIDTLFFTEIGSAASAKFLFYVFCTIRWQSYNEASGVPSLNASTIEGIEFRCPELREQEAVAAVLSDMDAELAALEQRRDKTRLLKQGMMQELLTGRTRLV